jgi:hypothetical protein
MVFTALPISVKARRLLIVEHRSMKIPWKKLPSWLLPFVLGSAAMFGVVTLVWCGRALRSAHASVPVVALTQSSTSSAPARAPEPAPWGELEAREFPLADAEETAPEYAPLMAPPRWFFESTTAEQLARYFRALDVRHRDQHLLLDPRYLKVTSRGCEITPPESTVYALDSINRARIYAALARSESNQAQRAAILLPAGNLEGRLAAMGLTRRQIDHLEHLTYTNGGMICLADLGIARKVLGAEAFDRMIEILYSIPAYRLRLVVPEHADVDRLAAYWGRGGREAEIRPLLKSLARVPGGADISIAHFLPDFARLRLYRYPEERDGPTAAKQDCIFTAMNFFNGVADTNFLDGHHVEHALETDYMPVTEAPLFGDIVILQDKASKIIHMCVYIAADFVFTKNGMSPTRPWALMRLDDMLAVYFGQQQNVELRFMRAKKLDLPPAPISVASHR